MKLIYVVIDGMGDRLFEDSMNRTPLEEAETPNMDYLAKHGKTGLMYSVRKGIAPESDVAVISLLGYDPFKYSTGRGIIEAIGAGLKVSDGDLSLRCNFATLGAEKRIIDRRVGRDLTTEEATQLSRAINKEVKLEKYPAEIEFKNTIGHRAVLVIRSKDQPLSSMIQNTDPAYSRLGGVGIAKSSASDLFLKKCEPIENTFKAKISADLVNEFTEKSHQILREHRINNQRRARGKLEANLVLSRDASHLMPRFFPLQEKFGLKFVSLTDMPVERGISKLTGMHIVNLPPPSKDIKSDCELRAKKLLELLAFYDNFYVHIKGPDESGHDGDFQQKTREISIIDKCFFKEIMQKVNTSSCIFCVTADHSTPWLLKSHTDDPVPLLISGGKILGDSTVTFSEKACKKGSLGVIDKGFKLMPILINVLKE